MNIPAWGIVLLTLAAVYVCGAVFVFVMMTHFSVRKPPTFVWGYMEWGEAAIGSFLAWPYYVFKGLEGAWND